MPKKPRDHIEKAEDRIWHEWFDKLTDKDHKAYMQKLGLDDEDQAELPEIEKELNEINSGDTVQLQEQKHSIKKGRKK
ncbi:MAG: hypothetical protein V1847_02385 [Candidatus Diapherotrites archaeon]